MCHYLWQDYKTASYYLELASIQNRSNCLCFLLQAKIYIIKKMYKRALKFLDECENLLGDKEIVFYEKSCTYMKEHNFEKAYEYCSKLTKIKLILALIAF